MRLSQILCKWPRARPNGHIWTGKHRMVRLVKDHHLNKMNKQIEMASNTPHINNFLIVYKVTLTFDYCRRRTMLMLA